MFRVFSYFFRIFVFFLLLLCWMWPDPFSLPSPFAPTQAIQLLTTLKARRNCAVNVRSYTPLVEALARDLRWEEAIMLFQEMENRKITPTVQSYTRIVHA